MALLHPPHLPPNQHPSHQNHDRDARRRVLRLAASRPVRQSQNRRVGEKARGVLGAAGDEVGRVGMRGRGGGVCLAEGRGGECGGFGLGVGGGEWGGGGGGEEDGGVWGKGGREGGVSLTGGLGGGGGGEGSEGQDDEGGWVGIMCGVGGGRGSGRGDCVLRLGCARVGLSAEGECAEIGQGGEVWGQGVLEHVRTNFLVLPTTFFSNHVPQSNVWVYVRNFKKVHSVATLERR